MLQEKEEAAIPIIDISPFLNRDEGRCKATLPLLKQALTEHGLFYVRGHGVDTSTILSQAKSFFDLEESKKQSVAIQSGGFTRGYVGMGNESGSDAFEVKEAFSYGFEWETLPELPNPLQGMNVWPKDMQDDFKSDLNRYYNQMSRVAEAIAEAVWLAFEFPDTVDNFCKNGFNISLMRLFHYYPAQNDAAYVGSSAHTDWGFLTLILQQPDTLGLQYSPCKDKWVDVQSIPGTLVVNAGDYLALLSQGQCISPLHRVTAPKSTENNQDVHRYSTVFFYYPNFEAKLPCLAEKQQQHGYSLLKDQGAKEDTLTSKQSFGEYILDKWSQVYRY